MNSIARDGTPRNSTARESTARDSTPMYSRAREVQPGTVRGTARDSTTTQWGAAVFKLGSAHPLVDSSGSEDAIL